MSESKLLERVEALTAPDEALDLAIAQTFVPDVICRRAIQCGSFESEDFTHWKYTGSVDAVIALSERVLQGWSYGLRCSAVWADHHEWAGKPVWEAIVANPGESDSYEPWCDHDGYNEDGDGIHEYEAEHWSPALALLAALLKASPEQSDV